MTFRIRAGYLPPTHVNIGEYWKIRDAAGYVLEDDMTTRSAAVHQWDRFGIEFHQFVSELGRDVRTRRRLSAAEPHKLAAKPGLPR